MILRNLALAYTSEGLYRKSETAAGQSLRILEGHFGAGDQALVPSLNVLGEALMAQRRYTEAGRVLHRAVALDGPGPHGATALHNLAALYQVQGDLPAAKRLYGQALERREFLLGAEHPVSLATRNALEGLQAGRRRKSTQSSALKQ